MPVVQSDLFDRPGLAGLTQAGAIVTPNEERVLIAAIDDVELSPFRFHGWLGKRLTASYGWRYDFDSGSFGPTNPIPNWLLPVREKAASFARLSPNDLVQALVIRYDPGAGIGWHCDRPVFEHVLGVSLGAPSRCGSGDAGPAASNARRHYWHPGRSTISQVRRGTNGNTASRRWR